MIRSSFALPPYAMEVPVTGELDASRIPTLEIDADCGPSKFDFNSATIVGCSLSSNVQNPIALSASQDDSKALIWELDSEKPCILSLRHFSVNGGEEDIAVHLNFSAPILPCISSCPTTDGTKLFCLTADGALHLITHHSRKISNDTAPVNPAFTTEAVQSTSLASAFDRLGAPTALVYVQGTVCIGTSLGYILCLPSDTPTPDMSFELDANAGLLNNLLSGFFNRGKSQDVEQLVELRFMDKSFLCSLHCGGVLRLWDLMTRKMVHSCDLIPPEEAAAHKATLTRVAVEPLDATCSILLIFFEPIDSSSAASGMLCTFELFLEDRGGSIKVLMEGGPRLASGVFRLVDLAVQHMGVHSIGAWMLYDDEQGRRKMHCVPLAFADGVVKSSVEVLLIEEQVEGTIGLGLGHSAGVGSSNITEQQIETLSRLATTLESSMPRYTSAISNSSSTDEDVLIFRATDVFQDAIFAPGHLCRPALQQAVEQVQLLLKNSNLLLLSSEDILKLDVASLQSRFTQAVNTAAVEHLQGPLGVWIEVINAYTDALRSYLAPRALVKLSVHREEEGLLVIRRGGSLSVVRAAEPGEIVAAGSWPPIWDKMRSSDSRGVKSILHAAGLLVDQICAGRQALMMIQGCIIHGADLRAHILPAVLRWMSTFSGNLRGVDGITTLDHDDGTSVHSIPLKLGALCSAPSKGFASAIEAVVTLIANDCVPPGGDGRSPLTSFSMPIISASMAQAHQTAAAQCDCLLRVALLAAYVTSQHQLGTWTVPEQDRQLLLGAVSDRLDWMLAVARVAYWSTATPIAKGIITRSSIIGGGGGNGVKPPASDAATMVISLKIGDDGDGDGRRGHGSSTAAAAAVARKRARLTPSPTFASANEYAYPAEHLLSTFQSRAHAVRDLPDLQRIAATFSSWLLCVPKVHDIDLRRTNTPTESIALQRTLEVAPVLIRTHSATALAELMLMTENVHLDDPRVMFFSACSKALTLGAYQDRSEISDIRSVNVIRKLEKESVSLFFRVAAALHIDVAHREYFEEKLKGVYSALEDLLSSFTSHTTKSKVILPSDASKTQVAAADELFYHESLMIIFEKLNCHHAASRFAMAAAQHVPDALPGDNMAEERVKRTGRLWSSVFTFCLHSGEFEEAYSALLGNELAEVQVDCVHKLVNSMVQRGEIAALCALPFAHTSLVVRNGQPAWVSLLDEAVSALKKRAELSELDSRPQPYQVLYDFHVARGNFQAAAAAMVSYARRLAAEAPEDRNAVDAAQKALAAAVGALGLVDSARAWLEDPSGVLNPKSKISKHSAGFVGETENRDEENDVLWVPTILTMSDLKIEHAIAVAKSSVAAVLPGGDVGTKTASDVFHQLIALKLHQEAFALADAAFIGTKQQRMREKAMFSLATTCAELQLQTGIGSSAGRVDASYYTNAGGSDEGMLTDDGAAENEVGGGTVTGDREMTTSWCRTSSYTTSSAAPASWRRLRTHLERYEKQGFTAGAMNLRVLAVDAVLATNSFLQPPLWLLAPFFPPPSEGPLSAKMPNADVAGLLRAYINHGRVEDAAVLAVKVLSKVAQSVPSVSLPRPAAVCFPHALLEDLATRVSSASPVKSDLTEKLNKAQAAAARQTQVLENMYAA
ncbi:hypothetical protein KSW81_003334 [Nannochloris sp. 'desiccata']|nr:hypothetical protein KSW81_003334 [Chlorella desiccata (nom. nud.)]